MGRCGEIIRRKEGMDPVRTSGEYRPPHLGAPPPSKPRLDPDVHFYTGPMGSGKTKYAVMAIHELAEAGYRCVCIALKANARDGALIRSHDGHVSVVPRVVETLAEYTHSEEGVDKTEPPHAVLVDEVQFASVDDVRAFLAWCVEHRVRAVLAGLTTDKNDEMWPAAAEVLRHCPVVARRTGACATCMSRPAVYTHANPERIDPATRVVTGNDGYFALCRVCAAAPAPPSP